MNLFELPDPDDSQEQTDQSTEDHENVTPNNGGESKQVDENGQNNSGKDVSIEDDLDTGSGTPEQERIQDADEQSLPLS